MNDTYLETVFVCTCCNLRKSACACDSGHCPSQQSGFNHPHYAVAVDRLLYNAEKRAD